MAVLRDGLVAEGLPWQVAAALEYVGEELACLEVALSYPLGDLASEDL